MMVIKNKRRHIIETAMMLFVNNGFHSTPTSLIAKKAHVSVGTLFNHFKTKANLIEQIYIDIKVHLRDTFLELLDEHDNQHDQLQSMYRAIVLWGYQNPKEFYYLELFDHSPFKNIYKTNASLIMNKQFKSEIFNAISPNSICHEFPDYSLIFIDRSIHAATRFLLEEEIDDINHFINDSFDLFWNGFKRK
ncbi:MAG: TetR/AcrR family transcriptional regulator [Candidatus Izemoplasma sp.]|nr:TetR/AcrR family transcriptional regulator [Candidatus Izemoplasma sp.]